MGKKKHEISPKQAIEKLFKEGKTTSTLGLEPEERRAISKQRWNIIIENYIDYPVYQPGNNPQMLLLDEKNELLINCLYDHIDPRTDVVNYTGKGPRCRAYDMISRRDHDHSVWFDEILDLGYSDTDIVKIRKEKMNDFNSRASETISINLHIKEFGRKPKFNK